MVRRSRIKKYYVQSDPSTMICVHKFHSASWILNSLRVLSRYHWGKAGQTTSLLLDAYLVLINVKKPTIAKMPTKCMIINASIDSLFLTFSLFFQFFQILPIFFLFFLFLRNLMQWNHDSFHLFVLLRLHLVTEWQKKLQRTNWFDFCY